MSPWVIIIITVVFAYFIIREIRDHLMRDYRLAGKASRLLEQRRFEEALPFAEKALALYERRLDPDEEGLIEFVNRFECVRAQCRVFSSAPRADRGAQPKWC